MTSAEELDRIERGVLAGWALSNDDARTLIAALRAKEPPTVHVVTEEYPHDGCTTLAVFTKREAADAYVTTLFENGDRWERADRPWYVETFQLDTLPAT